MSITPCLLHYPIGRAGKTKEVAKAQVHPPRGLFEEKPIPALYACVEVEELLKSIYDDTEIDVPTADGKNCLGECVGSTVLWHKRDILLVSQITMPAMEHISPQTREESPVAPPSPAAPPITCGSAITSGSRATGAVKCSSVITSSSRGMRADTCGSRASRAVKCGSAITFG